MKKSLLWKSFLIFSLILALSVTLFFLFGGDYVFEHRKEYFFPHFWAEVLASLVSIALISYPVKLFFDYREKHKEAAHEKRNILSIFSIIRNELREDKEKFEKIEDFVSHISQEAGKNYEEIEDKNHFDKCLVSYANEIQVLFHNRMGEKLLNNSLSFIHNPKSPYFNLFKSILEDLMRYYDLNHRFRQSWRTIAQYIEDYQKSLTVLYKNVYEGVTEHSHKNFKINAEKFDLNLPDLEKHFLEHLNDQVELKNFKINEFKDIVLEDHDKCQKSIRKILNEIENLLQKISHK